MKQLVLLLKKPKIILCAAAVAFILIFLCFLNFRMQVDSYMVEDMSSQSEAIQKNSTMAVRNEMNYLKRLTASAAKMVSREEIQTDEDILQILQQYASTSNLVRTLFITLDGHVYTSYAGYLGQSSEDTSIDGIPLSEITAPIFAQAYYAEDLGEAIFGVVAPTTMGEKQGVLVSSYNVKEFSKLLENNLIDGSADIGIINRNGEVVSGRSVDEFRLNIFDSLRNVKYESSSVDVMRTDFANGRSGFSIYRVGDVTRYCSYAPIGLNDWYVVVMIKEDSLRVKLANLERYGFQLTVELIIVMLSLLFAIMANWIQEQKRIRVILEQAAMMDGLTGIYNRKATEEMIEQSLRVSESEGAALLAIDMDDFKKINDQGGHLFGDDVLKECADRLKYVFGDEGIIGRVGGDEFIVFLPKGRDMDWIEKKVEAFICDFDVPTEAGERQRISVSVGIVQAGAGTNSFSELYRMADEALYRAKQTGKGKLSS